MRMTFEKKIPSKNANVVDSLAKRLKAVWPKKIFNLTKLYSLKSKWRSAIF